jgi:CubicO group peptidase (beta-lactamase class C family)
LGDIEKKMTPNTIISIGSLAKSLTSLSILLLVEQGLIDLETPLINYLPYFRLKDKEQSASITVKQILSHTAGLPTNVQIGHVICPNRQDYLIFEQWMKRNHVSEATLKKITNREELTRYFSNISLEYKPGSNWNYCSDAYIILGDLIEKVAGTSWEEFVNNNVLKSIGMEKTTFSTLAASRDPDSARYYTNLKNVMKTEKKPSPDSNVYCAPFPDNPIGAPKGHVYSTSDDLAKFLGIQMNYNSRYFYREQV